MNSIGRVIALVLAAAVICGSLPSTSFADPLHNQQTEPDEGREMYKTLRDQIFSVSSADLGLPPGTTPYGAVMEFDVGHETVTVVAYATGDASIYFSNGGGMIGGVGQPEIAEAAKAFVEATRAVSGSLSTADGFPRPVAAEVRFYVLTTEGVLTVAASIEAVASGSDTLSSLFNAANGVITQYRLLGR
jgi:hypothetical protein